MTTVPYHQITKAGLIEIAERFGIRLPSRATRSQIIEAIQEYHQTVESFFEEDSCHRWLEPTSPSHPEVDEFFNLDNPQ